MCIKHCNQITSFNVYTQISDFDSIGAREFQNNGKTTLNAHEIAPNERKTLSEKEMVNGEW